MMISPRIFNTSAALQDHLLQEAGPGALVLVPHQRLAQQLWRRQRRAQMQNGRLAWEPLPVKTFQGWLHDLYNSLWPEVALAPDLRRLSLWLRAIKAAPPLDGAAADLSWAQALDETYSILCRHQLLAGEDARPSEASPLIAWRRQVTANFARLLAAGGWLAPGELTAYLLARLPEGKIALPGQIMVVGLENPAPAEQAFLTAVARSTRLVQLQVQGDPQSVQQAVVLPNGDQEVAWVAARLLQSAARDGLPLHRLAVTAMDLQHYGPRLQRAFTELLGPAQSEAGWAYNFSQGPLLSETPLFLAATLPLRFIAAGERREDLVSLLLSPFYRGLSRHRGQTARWDRIFRERRLDQGWQAFRKALARDAQAGAQDLLPRLNRLWASLGEPAAAGQWRRRLDQVWQELAFNPAAGPETVQWSRLQALLPELDLALGSEPLKAGEFLAWLEHSADRVRLPGPGVQDAGLQVLGLLEMRGLEFDRVFCLGMNSGVLPPPPRSLPLLTAAERRRILGGSYASQHEFARDLYDNLLGAAPELVLSRPQVTDNEERVGSPLYLGPWAPEEMAPLSRPDPAWLRSPAVQAALSSGNAPFAGYGDGPLSVALESEVSLSKAAIALNCPCHFLLEVILKLKELPEIESGLDPRERGDRLHRVLASFTAEFNKFLEEHGWDHDQALELLEVTARQVLGDLLEDLHWRAELERWLGGAEAGRSLLQEWLLREKELYKQGWRWQLIEAAFAGLKEEGWPFGLKGRLDRLDYHPESREAIVFDYKSGEVPSAKKVFDELQEVQLPCYLLAVERGLTEAPGERRGLKAGYIGLKSPREKHLKHEDFEKRAGEWPRVAAALVKRLQDLGRRLAAGDFRPQPTPAPEGKDLGACQYCPYALLCGFAVTTGQEAEGEEAD